MIGAARTSRRAYVLPLVILLSLMGSLVVAVCLERYSAQRLLVQRQVVEYRRHHQLLGAQAIIRGWLGRQQGAGLARLADTTDAAHRFVLPEGLRIALWIRDGQGAAKIDLTAEPEPKRTWFELVLYRLPTNVPDLVRRIGPAEISINSAPKAVLAALREDGDDLAESIVAERADQPLDRNRFKQLLERTNASQEEISELSRLVTFEPTLWRIIVEASDDDESRLFSALVEYHQNKALIHEWRELSNPFVARELLGDAATLLLTPESQSAIAASETPQGRRSR